MKTIIGSSFDKKTKAQLNNLAKFKVAEQVFKPRWSATLPQHSVAIINTFKL